MKLSLNRLLSRRTFMRVLAQLGVAATILPEHLIDAAVAPGAPQSLAYGRGAYGQGFYAGYQVYLPFINKEEG